MKRRTIMASAVGAGLAGAGLALLMDRPNSTSSLTGLWQLQAPTPSGSMLKLSEFRGKPLLLNFWATWCPPCVEELPLLNNFHHQQRHWNVLALAADQPTLVMKFLQRMPLDLPIAIAGLEAIALSRQLGNEQGGLPFTVAFDRQGNAIQRKIGQITPSDLNQWLNEIR